MNKFYRFLSRPLRRPTRRKGMNKTEEKYCAHLEQRRIAGEICAWKFEGLTLKLADDTRYTPDFIVVTPDHIELHEVKGRWKTKDGGQKVHFEDDSRVKFRVAIDQFWWFRFTLVYWDGQGWKLENYS